ncbi:hypothetical protein [Armatimonas sp.]|uniref:hypothetical protein n=1 Tax=Armatimonas sp. TaxID=1872638 RepID=UPI0037519F7B
MPECSPEIEEILQRHRERQRDWRGKAQRSFPELQAETTAAVNVLDWLTFLYQKIEESYATPPPDDRFLQRAVWHVDECSRIPTETTLSECDPSTSADIGFWARLATNPKMRADLGRWCEFGLLEAHEEWVRYWLTKAEWEEVLNSYRAQRLERYRQKARKRKTQ